MRLSWVLRRRRSISWRTGGSNVRAIAPPRTTRPVDQLPKTAKVQRIVGLFRLPRLYLRRAAGYALTGDVKEHCVFLLYGTGRNGKTLLLEALLGIVGDYGMMAPSHLLTASGRTQHLTAVADLDGKRLVGISEPTGCRFDEAQVKSLTGGESIRANRMYCDLYEFAPSHKLFMASNHKPATDEFTVAFWSRIRLIDFAITIPLEHQDKDLP